MAETSKVRISGTSTVLTYVHLHTVARFALSQAKETEHGSALNAMVSLVFTAFFLEAYLNHLGETMFSDWGTIGEWKRPKEKLLLICAELGLAPDLGRRPYQSFSAAFRYRNTLAHGKTATVEYSKVMHESQQFFGGDEAEWQAFATPERADSVLKDAVAIVREIHAKKNAAEDPFAVATDGQYAVERL